MTKPKFLIAARWSADHWSEEVDGPSVKPRESLRTVLNDLATDFANAVLAAIRNASLDDLLSESGASPRRAPGRPHQTVAAPTSPRAAAPKAKSARLSRRSSADIEQALSYVVGALKAGPVRSEQIQKSLGIDKRELLRVLRHGLATKKLKSKGQKRATLYSAA
jgi:hypothetical protein